ncbi:MAG: hypothetical protein DRI24_20260 [Deltaproteobacteria bacterium]|nr:MAG: hypothetical protein DRI24_20260 [Deltaproteobacteria bacterium]
MIAVLEEVLPDMKHKGGDYKSDEYKNLNDNIIKITTSDQGTSQSYAIKRLKRDRNDLFELVKSGDISPNAAMVQAGFANPKATIRTDSAESAASTIRSKCSDEFIFQLKQLL